MRRWIAGVLAACASAGWAAETTDRPNILLIVADDLGWADVGWHGARIRTPHMDGLVRGGVELDRHYVQPVCTPTRTALMSGRYPGRFGPQPLTPSNLRALPPGTPTLASLLKAAGYTTAMSGKWHLGARPEWGPNAYGFDSSHGSLTGAVDPWQHTYRSGPYEKTWHRDGVRVDEEGNATDLCAREIVRRIETCREPWFIYAPFFAVHIPVDAPEEFKAPYRKETFDDDPAKNESYQRLAAFVTQMDARIGDYIAALEKTGRRGRTLVVFTSDNGGLPSGGNPYVGKVPPTPRLSSNLPLRGHKGQLYEGGIRVSAFANWPGRLAPHRVAAPMHAVDWLPTLLGVAGVPLPEGLRPDGRDMWPWISGAKDDASAPPRGIYWAFTGRSAVLQGDWKLIDRTPGAPAPKKGAAGPELFNLRDDPYEAKDLAAAEPARVKALQELMRKFREDDIQALPADLEGIPK
jgi:arylsulfatase A-like enzyme